MLSRRPSGRRVLICMVLAFLYLSFNLKTQVHKTELPVDDSNMEYLQSDRRQFINYDDTLHRSQPNPTLLQNMNPNRETVSKEYTIVDTDTKELNISTKSVAHHLKAEKSQSRRIYDGKEDKSVDANGSWSNKVSGSVSQNYRKSHHKLKKSSFQKSDDNFRKWRSVGPSNDLFVFSAYFDHVRLNVEVVALISRGTVYLNVECQFDTLAYVTNASLIHVDTPEIHVKYHTVLIQCPVPVYPERVSVRLLGFTTQLKVILRSSLLHDFTVCLPCLFGPFVNTSRLIETIEMDSIFGAGFFTVYRYSTSPEVDRLLDHYVQTGRLEVVEWNKPEVDLHHYGQWAHIQDCLLSNRYRTRYLVVKDLDELIVPRTHSNWIHFINELQTNPNISCFVFQNVFFDMHLKDYSWRNLSMDHQTHHNHQQTHHLAHHLACLTHLQRLPRFSPVGFRVKSVIRPEAVRVAGIHMPVMLSDAAIQVDVSTDIAFVHHYREGFPKFKETIRDQYMLKFTSELLRRWEKVMKAV